MTAKRQSVGRWGENLAQAFLQQRGYSILERNARTPYGELDLVARRGDMLVFVEVKTRLSRAYGVPETAVTLTKQTHLLQAAQAYLQLHPELELDWRIDVIAVQGNQEGGAPEIVWFENAVS